MNTIGITVWFDLHNDSQTELWETALDQKYADNRTAHSLPNLTLKNYSPRCRRLHPSSSLCPSVWVAVGPVLRWIPIVRRSICEPYLILLICLQNKKEREQKKQKREEGGKTREKVSLSFWGADRLRPNELKDVNNVLALPLDPFLCQILERNEAKFSLLLKSVVRDMRCSLPPLPLLWVFV